MKSLASLGIASLLLLLSAPVVAEDAPSSDKSTAAGKAMTAAAEQLLATLDDTAKAKATMSFDDPRRVDWHNIPKAERKGLQYRDMTEEQRKATHELLKAGLSKTGYDKATKIMSLENNLREGEKNTPGSPFRDPQRYFLTIFGTPTTSGEWGWSWEGHHLSLNFVIKNGEVIASTPNFWGANPATLRVFVDGGPELGTRTLADEEQLAFDLVNSLSDEQRKVAVIADKAPADYRNAGVPTPPEGPPEGIAYSKLNDEQKKLLDSLLETYCGHLPSDVGDAELQRIKAADPNRIHFAWLGATKPAVGHSYRVQGPTFLLEFVNVQSDAQGGPANHIHSVWRNVEGDFALPLAKTK